MGGTGIAAREEARPLEKALAIGVEVCASWRKLRVLTTKSLEKRRAPSNQARICSGGSHGAQAEKRKVG